MRKHLLLIILLFAGFFGFSQTAPLPKDHPVALAAPHLPLITRFDGTGTEFHGDKYSYNLESNTKNMKDWIKSFPDELETYKTAIALYLKSDASTMPDADKEIFTDLKSQWFMIIQL